MLPALSKGLSCLTALCCLATLAAAEPVTVETARGPVTLSERPARIAVYDIAALDTLAALDVPVAGVAQPHFVPYLDAAAARARPIGSFFEPDFEALANLRPDVILIGPRTVRRIPALERIAPVLDLSVWGSDQVALALERLEALGALTGREAAAAGLAARLEAKLAATRAAVAGKGAGLILLTNGPKVSAFGAGSRFGWLHGATGLPEAVSGLGDQPHGEAVSFEFIAEADPDWLLVIDRSAAIGEGGAGAAETLDNALVARTTAWRKGQVVYLDPAALYVAGGGVQAIARTLDRLIAAFGGAS